jgi:N-acetyl-1-D-myo-inositol-2-amino-2-deoxy-alpha-D-glucopyranoside deacetylase
VVPDEVVTHEVVRPDLVSVQAAALAAHETQVRVLDGYYALSNDVAARLPGREGFAQVDLHTGRPLVGGSGGSVAGAGSRRGLLDAAGARA